MDKLKPLPPYFHLSKEVAHALSWGNPVVALESTVITHGLPSPQNLESAQAMEAEVRRAGAIPATIAVLEGAIRVGLAVGEMEHLVQEPGLQKIGPRDFARAILSGESGGTTVASTMWAADTVGIRVFATGGIGGVHRGDSNDVSADLPQLARTPMIVVSAGAKAILDLPATIEYLETYAVPVVGFGCDHFPAFYSENSGLGVNIRLDSAEQVVEFARTHWNLGFKSAILVTVPPPRDVALPLEQVAAAIDRALADAERAGVRGQKITPYLLERVSQLTGSASLRANLGLLQNNAHVGALIAAHIAGKGRMQVA